MSIPESMMAGEHASASHDDHAHPHVNYRNIFIALCVCTVISWLADEAFGWGLIQSKRIIAVLVLAVAVAKAQYVMRYFMHLKFEGKWKYVLLLPTAILACGIPLALAPDIGLHYYTPTTPQVRVLRAEAAHGHESDSAHPEAEGTGGHAAPEGGPH